jgi:hypothetical protein
MSFKQDIEKLIESNLKTYRDNSDRFVADYNRELELTKEYNGRQLLELLQNADDAGSQDVEIVWDKATALLTISNKGEAFSVGGIKSLMIANLSTKTKISYIGNKGLGFRSILNWAEHINIFTNACKISFSEVIAKEVFEHKLNLSETDRDSLREERNLATTAVPFPTLAVPRIEDDKNKSYWTTAIEISCKREFENDIEKQLSEIREEILLFLNNIQRINIRYNGDEKLQLESVKKEENGYEVIKIKEKSWKVFTKENILPEYYQDKSKNEQQSYSLKVAFQDDLSDDYKKLFNFFPTRLSISLPCIIHGTFELNSSRNHLNESKKNEYILKELVELLKECSLFLTTENIDWRPYRILTTTATASDSRLIEAFYKDLEEIKNKETIYPCISNQYKTLDEVVYYDDEFESFFMAHFPEALPELLIPLGNEVVTQFHNNKFKHKYLVEKIDGLSQTNISIPLRAELIAKLSKVISFNDSQERFSLLINESGKVISKEDLAFTPVVRSEENFSIPAAVKVDFIKPALYDILISKYEQSFDKKEQKSRELQRIIKSVVNIQPYDSNNVIEKIITGTKDALKSLSIEEEKISCIKEMVAALYANFKNIENRQEKLKIAVPLISKTNEIKDANDLFLSKTYPSGVLTEIIYENVFKSRDYLAYLDVWNLENEYIETIEIFFLWLGVNKFTKIIPVNLQNNYSESEYITFIFANGTERPDNFQVSRIQRDSIVYKIDRFDEIQKLPVNKIILLVLKDSFVRKQLEGNDERINWYYVTWRPTIISNYSYLRFQFLRTNLFIKYILEEGSEELNKLINDEFQIDYDFLGQYGINKTEVKSILIKLGAKESFNDILPENVYEILRAIPEKDESQKGRATQTIYKMALESLVKQASTFPVPDDILLFSRKGDIEEYQIRSNVYYADNSILPKKMLNTLPILNLPKRSGEDNVEKYFGVKSLREFKIQINESKIQYNPCDAELNRLFEVIKPYILAYRLDSPNIKKRITDSETKKKEARTLKQCKIHIVAQCFFRFGESEEIPIDDKEFINIKDIFYFKENSLISTDSLRKDSLFCDAFAEMMCIIFKVNDLKNDFRQILKNDLQDTIHLATQDLGKDKIEEAFKLLGVSRVEFDFWKNVFVLCGKQLPEPVENTDALKQKVQQILSLNLPAEYSNVNFENFDNKEYFELIKQLSNELSLSVQQICPCGLYNWHKIQFTNTLKDLKYYFEQLTWLKLKDNPKDQSNFISILNKYNLSFIDSIESEIISTKYELNVEYHAKLKNLINVHFNINIDDALPQNNIINNLYSDLLNNYSIEEVDISDESIRSLLYFEGNNEPIETYLKEHFDSNKEGDFNGNSEESKVIGTVIDASLTKNTKVIAFNPSGNGSGEWVHSGQNDRHKQRKGKKAELLVYDTLVNQYGCENVKWVSGNSKTPDKNDKLHYDIEYKNDEGEWKYLEVKAMSDNQFIISASEKEKGMSESEKYEMALVSENIIYMIKDIFKFNHGESFESNSKFVAYTKDYVFSFNVNTLKKD